MRVILFFDLPMLTSTEQSNYRKFRKKLIKLGFFMLQKSVYVRLIIDQQALNSLINKVKEILPPNGDVMMINLTEKQFASKQILLGDYESDVINSDERIIIL